MASTAFVQPIDVNSRLTDQTYAALRQGIASMDIYGEAAELRLDERRLSEDLGVSRTPIREAIARLEHEGLVRTKPRKGAFIVRKTKDEILEIITVWAALESMAARLITLHAGDQKISTLRRMFSTFENDQAQAKIDEYSEVNIEFHQAIIRMSECQLLNTMTENLFFHMRAIRMRTIFDVNRAMRSIIDHMNIIEALERRDGDLAEGLVRQHSLDLRAHVAENVNYLD